MNICDTFSQRAKLTSAAAMFSPWRIAVSNRLAHLNACDLEHLVVQAFEMLGVHRAEYIDAGVQNHNDVLSSALATS
jgi:hypothetical protein